MPLSLEDESIYINDASAKLRQNGSQDLLLQGRIDLQDLLASKQLPAEMKLELRKESEGEGEAEEILSTQAGCRLDLQKNSLEIFDGQANLVPELLLQVFREQFERLYASIDEMIAGSRKMSLQYSLPEFDLRQPSSWLLLLQMQARDARFRNLRIHQMQAEAQINARNASFRRIQAQVDQDEELELDLFIDFKAPSLRVANAFVKARPELFDAFIFNEEASRIYALLWQNVRWDQEQPPKISIPELFFWEDPLHGKNWTK